MDLEHRPGSPEDRKRKVWDWLLRLAVAVLLGGPGSAAAAPGGFAGTAACADCHDQAGSMQESAHRALFSDSRLQTRHKGCEACHGPAADHVDEGGASGPPVNFKTGSADAINKACQSCHRQEELASFSTGGHGRDGKTSCVTCHSVHSAKEDRLLKQAQPDGCYRCHPGTRASMNMPSHHPIREGKMTCTGCHNPHGSASGARHMLARETTNETCLKCHSNLAGPWVFEHAPAAKDCLTCHRAHGSVNIQLLKMPEPALCVKCHNPEHSGFAARTNRTRSLQRQLAYQNCSACHPQIHGSDQDHGFTH